MLSWTGANASSASNRETINLLDVFPAFVANPDANRDKHELRVSDSITKGCSQAKLRVSGGRHLQHWGRAGGGVLSGLQMLKPLMQGEHPRRKRCATNMQLADSHKWLSTKPVVPEISTKCLTLQLFSCAFSSCSSHQRP